MLGADLFPRAHAEAGLSMDGAQLALDREMIQILDAHGMLLCYGAFDEGELIGYVVLTVARRLFHSGRRQAILVSIYVRPAFRGEACGVRGALMDAAEDGARARGADEVVWIARRGTSFAMALATHYPDERQEVVYVRKLR